MTLPTSEFFALIPEGSLKEEEPSPREQLLRDHALGWGGCRIKKQGWFVKEAPAVHTATGSAQALIPSALVKPTETIKISRIPRHGIQLTSHGN